MPVRAPARLGAGPAHLPQRHRAHRRAGLHGVSHPSMPGFGGTQRPAGRRRSRSAGTRPWVADLLDALEVDEPAVRGRPLVRRRRGDPLAARPSASGSARWCSSTRSAARRGERANAARRSPSARCGTGACTSRAMSGRSARRRGCCRSSPRTSCPTCCATRGRSSRSPTWPAGPTCASSWRRCATAACRSRSSGARATAIIPRESFEALCVASGVEGTVVEGSSQLAAGRPGTSSARSSPTT